jgi:hypothetical protein
MIQIYTQRHTVGAEDRPTREPRGSRVCTTPLQIRPTNSSRLSSSRDIVIIRLYTHTVSDRGIHERGKGSPLHAHGNAKPSVYTSDASLPTNIVFRLP